MASRKREIPYFIKIGGCNNCKVSQAYLTKTGTFYEEGHALHAKCVHMECVQYGYSVEEPFITPKEFIRIGARLNNKAVLNKAKRSSSNSLTSMISRETCCPGSLRP